MVFVDFNLLLKQDFIRDENFKICWNAAMCSNVECVCIFVW